MSAKTATKTAEVKKEFNLERALVMWIYKAKNGESKYLSGKTESGIKLTGFFNTQKQNPKEPDIKLYAVGEENELSKEVYLSLWVKANSNGKKYLTGKLNGKWVVGFFNSKAKIGDTIPYINVYFSDEKKEDKVIDQPESMKQPKFEEIPNDSDLPF